MRTRLNLLLAVMLMVIAAGCRTRTVVIDRQSDWVRLGNDVRGHIYLYRNGGWERQPDTVKLPEGWVAGPEP